MSGNVRTTHCGKEKKCFQPHRFIFELMSSPFFPGRTILKRGKCYSEGGAGGGRVFAGAYETTRLVLIMKIMGVTTKAIKTTITTLLLTDINHNRNIKSINSHPNS